MEEKIKALEGITYSEWQKIKIVIDNKFSAMQRENTFNVDKSVFDNLKIFI